MEQMLQEAGGQMSFREQVTVRFQRRCKIVPAFKKKIHGVILSLLARHVAAVKIHRQSIDRSADCADNKNMFQIDIRDDWRKTGRMAVNVARTEELRSKIRRVTPEVAVSATMKNWRLLFVIVRNARSRIPPR